MASAAPPPASRAASPRATRVRRRLGASMNSFISLFSFRTVSSAVGAHRVRGETCAGDNDVVPGADLPAREVAARTTRRDLGAGHVEPPAHGLLALRAHRGGSDLADIGHVDPTAPHQFVVGSRDGPLGPLRAGRAGRACLAGVALWSLRALRARVALRTLRPGVALRTLRS